MLWRIPERRALGPLRYAVPELDKNHFALFDLPLGYAVDAGLLADRYRALTRVAETAGTVPDAHRECGESAYSLSRIEEAYRTLIDPLARADYLLDLYAIDQDAEPPVAFQVQDGAFLIERMELQELLAAAAHRADPATAVAELLTQLAEQSAALDKALQALFADPSAHNLCIARALTRKLQYLGNCRRDADAWLAELGIRD